ncbi:hypothetical protein F4553_001573 [Allocatelliglobosispora scoriae]|uniref:Uncharacterized protein n=1 Tax=Allocatelliglobosispora scoriae TaxID=643052 RepID=A0A841BIV4_9ACTN|nr:hypothetical protein [Allocatelliglobosispora scoriae]MBB5868194.1 hypothetical protein [Allocatelliglobosispora scoriae]
MTKDRDPEEISATDVLNPSSLWLVTMSPILRMVIRREVGPDDRRIGVRQFLTRPTTAMEALANHGARSIAWIFTLLPYIVALIVDSFTGYRASNVLDILAPFAFIVSIGMSVWHGVLAGAMFIVDSTHRPSGRVQAKFYGGMLDWLPFIALVLVALQV